MWRLTLSFFWGIFLSAVLLSAVAVFIFRDVDEELTGKWNEAFERLTVEALVLALLVAGSTLVLTQIGRLVMGLRPLVPPSKLGFFVGVGVSVVQYACDAVMRKLTDEHHDLWLAVIMLLAVLLSATTFLAACHRKSIAPAL